MSDANSHIIKALCRGSSISDYLTKRGVEVMVYGGHAKCRCPFPEHKGGHESTPSFNIGNNDGREFFYCFGCSTGGDVISLMARLEGKKNGEIINRLAKAAGVDLGTFDPASRVDPLNDEVMQAFCDEDDEAISIYSICRAFLAAHGGAEDAVDRVDRVYQMLDDFMEYGEGMFTTAKYKGTGIADIYAIKNYALRLSVNYAPPEAVDPEAK